MRLSDEWRQIYEYLQHHNLIRNAYVFGSSLRTPFPNDIDILLVCEPSVRVRKILKTFRERDPERQIDILVLTPLEEAQYSFIKQSGAVKMTQSLVQ